MRALGGARGAEEREGGEDEGREVDALHSGTIPQNSAGPRAATTRATDRLPKTRGALGKLAAMSNPRAASLCLLLVSVSACAGASRVDRAADRACAAGGELSPGSDEERTLYALGVVQGQRLHQFNLNGREAALVARGMQDSISGGARSVNMREMMPRIQELAESRGRVVQGENLRRGAAFEESAAREPGARRLGSGLVFRSVAEGSGASPTARDTVTVRYRGTLIDGTEFDASRDGPATFALEGVIPCWTEALALMRPGGRAQFVCPAALAYGERGNRTVPAGSTLVFEVELVSVAPSRAAATEAAAPER